MKKIIRETIREVIYEEDDDSRQAGKSSGTKKMSQKKKKKVPSYRELMALPAMERHKLCQKIYGEALDKNPNVLASKLFHVYGREKLMDIFGYYHPSLERHLALL